MINIEKFLNLRVLRVFYLVKIIAKKVYCFTVNNIEISITVFTVINIEISEKVNCD